MLHSGGTRKRAEDGRPRFAHLEPTRAHAQLLNHLTRACAADVPAQTGNAETFARQVLLKTSISEI